MMDNERVTPSERPFGSALRSLLADRQEFLTRTGNINWASVAEAMPGIYYESLRKAVTGERQPSRTLMERAAKTAGVKPTYFVEYQLAEARRQFDPGEVGWEAALENLDRFARGSV
jgi:hypothetical protein